MICFKLISGLFQPYLRFYQRFCYLFIPELIFANKIFVFVISRLQIAFIFRILSGSRAQALYN